jgi:integrase
VNSRLTDRFLKTVSVGQDEGRRDYPDGKGLHIRVSPTGSKTWVLIFRTGGKLRRLTLGTYPNISLAEARKKTAEIRVRIKDGDDPDPEATANRNSPTVEEFSKEYLERWAKPHKKSWSEDQRVLEKEFIPVIGNIKMTKLTRRDIVAALDRIRDRGAHTQANRALAIFRRMCRFAVERGLLETSPAVYIKATPEDSRDRALSRDEIRRFFEAMQKESPWIGTRLALEVLLRTGQRSSEVLQMNPQQIDLERALWTIPGDQVKNGHAQIVPLPEQVMVILKVAFSTTASETAVFRSPRKDSFLSKQALGRAMDRALKRHKIPHATPHDLRRTCATFMTELGVPRLVVSKILNHVDGSVDAVYDRHSYITEKREALEKWNNELDLILAGQDQGKVLRLQTSHRL